jgi:hypothetical protein
MRDTTEDERVSLRIIAAASANRARSARRGALVDLVGDLFRRVLMHMAMRAMMAADSSIDRLNFSGTQDRPERTDSPAILLSRANGLLLYAGHA